jgi:F-type H+-transporting ATPase subunit epsilon
MAENIQLEVVTPEKAVVNEAVQTVVAPGVLGEFGVLVGHTPFLTSVKTGTIRYIDAAGKENYLFVSGGFAEALPDKLTILAESAEKCQDIDSDRASSSKERAEKRLADKEHKEEIDRVRAKAALNRAMVRIKIANTRM